MGKISSGTGSKICVITGGNKTHKLVIKKKEKKNDKTKLNSIEVLISKSLMVSYNIYSIFVYSYNIIYICIHIYIYIIYIYIYI